MCLSQRTTIQPRSIGGGRTVHSHLPLVLQIALVRDNDDGERVLVFHAEDLLVERADFLKRVARCDGVDQEETLSRAHVLLTHRTVFNEL